MLQSNYFPSLYIISDSEFAAYKQQNLKRECASIQELIDGHHKAISRLENTLSSLEKHLEDNNSKTKSE
jgi:septation ring formation regulator EzrA